MIAHLSGLLLRKSTRSLVIDAGGIGYEVIVPLSTFYALPGEGERVDLHIYTHVREDALSLFGFHTRLEKDLFLMLIAVSGIGPKLAVNILSGIGPGELQEAMARGDALRLRSIPGVGKKTAERIALELKDRALKSLGDREISPVSMMDEQEKRLLDDALSALTNLGYQANSARKALEMVRRAQADITLEILIREALKKLA
ncbi:MAG: Holliday junction branch migration protein RuvA [Deltaproteobacteria bacterium]|nr:Holliday junction branch migration protein RuvA [Deltaproteobacteria bacterium]